MSEFDCKSIHHRCKAGCCGVFPIPSDIFNRNKEKMVRTPEELLESKDFVIPVTADNFCVFLNQDLSCNIYDDRPDICREFGNESHPALCCPYLDKEGRKRSGRDRRRVETNMLKKTNDIMNRFRIIQ